MCHKAVKGFQTGDMVVATAPKGLKTADVHIGRVAARVAGRFNVQAIAGAVQGISHKYCRLAARADGYGYSFQPKIANLEGGSEKRAA